MTPNADEAEALTGIAVTDVKSAREAARSLNDMGAKAVLVKGGHLEGEPVDVLFDGREFTEFAGKRSGKTHARHGLRAQRGHRREAGAG